ncbi:MAG: hypothetical protein J6N53_16595 [Lachnospiraceae bacterium]|nr:hypothetical protein [Lachnospiraceae bacterium]MBO6208979.1 hypothetical protein [Lachnospiraceae bacterium]MBO6300451.1 hypothetical protein [Lachnospiraceae bacterium]
MIPMGYGKSSLGTCFGVFIILGGVWLTTTLVKSGADMADARYIMIGAVLPAFLFIMMDLTNNLKNRNNIEYMHRMLEYPAVKGKIVEIKKYRFHFGVREEITSDQFHYRSYVYRVVASFYDEKNRCEKKVVSEFYARDPRRWILSDRVDIHYSPAGECWIELDEK